MKRIYKYCIASLLFLLCLAQAKAQIRTIYVVAAGISDYQYINDLRSSAKDAEDFAALYKTHTRHVTLLTGQQATRYAILQAFRQIAAEADREDIVVFFFSGHGGKGGLCTYDTSGMATALTYKDIQTELANCKAANKQMFIDACFSGGLRTKGQGQTATASQVFSKTEGVMLFLSSRTSEPSRERSIDSNSLFTKHLLRGLKGAADDNRDRIVAAKELFNYVSKKVKNDSKNGQNPVMWGKFRNDMHILNWNPL